jgi:hypothetical protein
VGFSTRAMVRMGARHGRGVPKGNNSQRDPTTPANAQFSLGLAHLKPIRTRPGPGLELLVGMAGTRVIPGRWGWGKTG